MCVQACVLSRFSRVWLCDPMVYGAPGSSVQGILQARIPERVTTPSSRGPSRSRDQTQVSYASCTGRRFFVFVFFFNHYCHLGSPVNIDTSLHLLVKLHEWTYMLLYPWTDMFHICLCVCVSSNEFAEACKHNDMSSCTWSMWACVFACTRARWSESVHMCARAYWSFLIFNNSCFNNICSWETALTAAAAPCYQDCFSPFRITSAQCSLNISPGLIPKQRCNDFC